MEHLTLMQIKQTKMPKNQGECVETSMLAPNMNEINQEQWNNDENDLRINGFFYFFFCANSLGKCIG